MLRVAANYHNASFAFDDFAFFAHGFNGRSYFHLKLPPCHEVLFTHFQKGTGKADSES